MPKRSIIVLNIACYSVSHSAYCNPPPPLQGSAIAVVIDMAEQDTMALLRCFLIPSKTAHQDSTYWSRTLPRISFRIQLLTLISLALTSHKPAVEIVSIRNPRPAERLSPLEREVQSNCTERIRCCNHYSTPSSTLLTIIPLHVLQRSEFEKLFYDNTGERPAEINDKLKILIQELLYQIPEKAQMVTQCVHVLACIISGQQLSTEQQSISFSDYRSQGKSYMRKYVRNVLHWLFM
jgi:hypothetical protein